MLVGLFAAITPGVLAEPQRETDKPKLQRRSKAEIRSAAIPVMPGVRCFEFDPKTLTLQDVQKRPKRKGALHWLFGKEFPESGEEKWTLTIIQYYEMNASCWVDDPEQPFHFMLTDGKAPEGKLNGEDCRVYSSVNQMKIQKFPFGEYKIVYGSEYMYSFRSENAALKALKIIHSFAFNTSCFVGRPDGSFHYLLAR